MKEEETREKIKKGDIKTTTKTVRKKVAREIKKN